MFEELLLLSLVTFSVSSMWLYSPGFERFRNWWIDSTGILSALGYCQLCCSFWIALVASPVIMYNIHIIDSIVFSLAVSGVSWMLGAITNVALWSGASACSDYKGRYEKL